MFFWGISRWLATVGANVPANYKNVSSLVLRCTTIQAFHKQVRTNEAIEKMASNLSWVLSLGDRAQQNAATFMPVKINVENGQWNLARMLEKPTISWAILSWISPRYFLQASHVGFWMNLGLSRHAFVPGFGVLLIQFAPTSSLESQI